MKFIIQVFKGVLIGLANIIPGVSGGTLMVSMGIYDTIISSITNLFRKFKDSIKTLLPYAVGMAAGIVGLAFLITHFLEKYPFQTNMLFIGLILGGIPMIWSKAKKGGFGFGKVLAFVFFAALIICLQLFGGEGGRDVNLQINAASLALLFFVGVITAATMVIPGVSGSMILMLLGYYNPVLSSIKNLIKALKDFNMDRILYNVEILFPFGIGVIVGIFLVAKLIEILMKKAEAVTYSGILGLIAASPIVILMINGISVAWNFTFIFSSAGMFILGFIGAYLLGRE